MAENYIFLEIRCLLSLESKSKSHFVYDIFFVSNLIHQAFRERFANLYSVYFRYKKSIIPLTV